MNNCSLTLFSREHDASVLLLDWQHVLIPVRVSLTFAFTTTVNTNSVLMLQLSMVMHSEEPFEAS